MMGAIRISFIHDPKTKRRELWIDYESSEDWLPIEHERHHKKILQKLFEKGQLSPDMIERIHIRVEGKEISDDESVPTLTSQPQKHKN